MNTFVLLAGRSNINRYYLLSHTSRSSVRCNLFCRTFPPKSKPQHECHNSVTHLNQTFHTNRQTLRKSGRLWFSTFRDRLREYRRNGIPEIIFGSLIISLVGIDFILQTRNDQQKETMYKQLEREVRRDEATSRMEDRKILEKGITTQFKCIIRKIPLTFDGHKCLTNVKVGDIVSVIEEGVGPGGQYNLCSIERMMTLPTGVESSESNRRVSIGWFPCSCLEKIEE